MRSRAVARYSLSILTAVMLSASPATGLSETLDDPRHGFSLVLPEGFVANPDMVGANTGIAYAYVRPPGPDEESGLVLTIEPLGGIIANERLSVDELPPEFQGRLFTTTWSGFEVDAFEVPEVVGGVEYISYNVQIPLKEEAIQVKLAGEADRKAELMQLLTEVLNGLSGESNWEDQALPTAPSIAPDALSDAPQDTPLNLRAIDLIVLIVIGVLLLVLGVGFLLVARRRKPQ